MNNKRTQSAQHPNNRTDLIQPNLQINFASPSIPSHSHPIKEIKGLNSQNIFKMAAYQNEFMLEELNEPTESLDKWKKKEQVRPLPHLFPQRKQIRKINLEEFMRQQYPILFNNQKKTTEKIDLVVFAKKINLHQQNILKIPEQDEKEISSIEEKSQQSNNQSLHNLNDCIQEMENNLVNVSLNSDAQLQYLVEVLKTSPERHQETNKKNDIKFQTLTEILGLNTREKRNAYRALPLKVQKEIVVYSNILHSVDCYDQDFKGQVLQKKMKDFEQQIKDGNKKYFQIINDLDLLKKGARELKNKTGQQFGLRKKTQEPNINKLIQEVKNTRWYTPGFGDEYQREFDLIKHNNNANASQPDIEEENINNFLEALNTREVPTNMNRVVDNRMSEKEAPKQLVGNQQKMPEKVKVQEGEKQILDVSQSSNQSTQMARSQVSQSFQISAKAKQMQSLMDDLF